MRAFRFDLDTGAVWEKEVPCLQEPIGCTTDVLESWAIDPRSGFVVPNPFEWNEDRQQHPHLAFGRVYYVNGEMYVIFIDQDGQVRTTTLCGELGWLNHTHVPR